MIIPKILKWDLTSFTEHRVFVPPMFPVEKCPMKLLNLIRFKSIQSVLGWAITFCRDVSWAALQLRYSLIGLSQFYFDSQSHLTGQKVTK